MTRVHPTAIVAASAELAGDVEIGPYSVVGARGRRSATGTTIGAARRHRRPHHASAATIAIFQFASVGEIPQDRKYDGDPTRTVIGDDNVIREFVTIHAGTAQDRGVTTIGNGNWLLAYSHVAHDCVIGNGTTFSNNAQLAGHVVIDDYAVLGGFVGVHQFCRVGAHAMLAAGSIVLQDVPPYVTVVGYPGQAARHQQRGPAPPRIQRRRHRRDQARVQDAVPPGALRSTMRARRSPRQPSPCPRCGPLAAFLETPGRGIVR